MKELPRKAGYETDDSISAEMLAEMERRDADYEACSNSSCAIEELEIQLFKPK